MAEQGKHAGVWTLEDWHVKPQGDGLVSVYGYARNAARTPVLVAHDLREHNAALIAAAPDLLAACSAVAEVVWESEEEQWPNDIQLAARKARAAIAKATP